MAGAPAAVGHDRGGGLHDRLPVRRGRVGDQYIAGPEVRQTPEVVHPFRHARGDLLTDRPALGQYLASALEHIGLQRRRAALGGHRLRAGLDDVELPVETVFGPLHVHRSLVVLLDGACIAGQLENVLIGEAEASTVGLRRRDVAGRVLRLTLDEDHLHRLVPDQAAQHGAVAGQVSRLVDVELIGVDGALNHVLAKAVGACHEDDVVEARLGVDGEHHTRRGKVGAHHLHHADRQRDLEMVEALVDAIVDGSVGEQAGETTAARVEETLRALDVEIGVLLAGEARRRQVLGGRRASHSETDLLAVLVLKQAVGVHDLGDQVFGKPGAVDDLARTFAFARQRGDVGRVEIVELGMQRVPGAGPVQHVSVGLGGDGEPVRDADALLGQLLEHLAERGVLTADERHVVDAKLFEEANVAEPAHNLILRVPAASLGAVGFAIGVADCPDVISPV